LANIRGERTSHLEKDRELEFFNGFIKRHRRRNYSSTQPVREMLRRVALTSKLIALINDRLARQTDYKKRSRHVVKSAAEDIRELAAKLASRSMCIKRGRQSNFTPQDLLTQGMKNLTDSLEVFNRIIDKENITQTIGLVLEEPLGGEEEEVEIRERQNNEENQDSDNDSARAYLSDSSAAISNFIASDRE
jgi:hypothetical protein